MTTILLIDRHLGWDGSPQAPELLANHWRVPVPAGGGRGSRHSAAGHPTAGPKAGGGRLFLVRLRAPVAGGSDTATQPATRPATPRDGSKPPRGTARCGKALATARLPALGHERRPERVPRRSLTTNGWGPRRGIRPAPWAARAGPSPSGGTGRRSRRPRGDGRRRAPAWSSGGWRCRHQSPPAAWRCGRCPGWPPRRG